MQLLSRIYEHFITHQKKPVSSLFPPPWQPLKIISIIQYVAYLWLLLLLNIMFLRFTQSSINQQCIAFCGQIICYCVDITFPTPPFILYGHLSPFHCLTTGNIIMKAHVQVLTYACFCFCYTQDWNSRIPILFFC